MESTNTIERSVVVAAPQARVWRALTEPERFSKWFEMDIRWGRLAVGEAMTFTMDGATDPGTIVAVEPQTRFAFTWLSEPGYDYRTTVTFVLEPVAEGTRVTVTESGFDALPDSFRQKRFDMNAEGWTIQMDNIARYLESADDAT
jgi:uncharacterized protein YndB with AHSA1/START domain